MTTKLAVNKALEDRGLPLVIERRGRKWFVCNKKPLTSQLYRFKNPCLNMDSLINFDINEVICRIECRITCIYGSFSKDGLT